jgi:hypothetical protein
MVVAARDRHFDIGEDMEDRGRPDAPGEGSRDGFAQGLDRKVAAPRLAARPLRQGVRLIGRPEAQRRLRLQQLQHARRGLHEGLPQRVLLFRPALGRGGAQVGQRLLLAVRQALGEHVVIGGNPGARPGHRAGPAQPGAFLQNHDPQSAGRRGQGRRQGGGARADDQNVRPFGPVLDGSIHGRITPFGARRNARVLS